MKKYSVKSLSTIMFVAAVAVSIPTSNLLAFGLGNIANAVSGSSSKSDVNWGDLSSTGKNAETDIYSGTRLMMLSTQTMAEALGYKNESAALAAQLQKINENGSVSGDFDLGETTEQAGSVMDKIVADKDQLASLDEKQKEKLSDSMKQYAIGGAKYILGLKGIQDVTSKASNAPLTQMANFVGIIKLTPTALTGAKHFFGKVPDVVNVMTAANIEVPDDMSNQLANF